MKWLWTQKAKWPQTHYWRKIEYSSHLGINSSSLFCPPHIVWLCFLPIFVSLLTNKNKISMVGFFDTLDLMTQMGVHRNK